MASTRHTKAELWLDRGVTKVAAAKKVAQLRRHAGREGGWIYTVSGTALCQGWREYADRLHRAGVIGLDVETGKWHVSIVYLTNAERQRAEELVG